MLPQAPVSLIEVKLKPPMCKIEQVGQIGLKQRFFLGRKRFRGAICQLIEIIDEVNGSFCDHVLPLFCGCQHDPWRHRRPCSRSASLPVPACVRAKSRISALTLCVCLV